MIRIPGRIPITITPGFWVVAAIIGYLNSFSLLGTLFWVGIIFISVLVHEFGHAISALLFGQKPRIDLVPFGGVTYPEGKKISLWKEFIVVFNGPLFGFFLFILASLVLPAINFNDSPKMYAAVATFRIVNLFWTVVNLLPVMPLDGGQLMRIALTAFFGYKAFRYSLFISMCVSAGISLIFFFFAQILIGALFFLFAFQNFETWRRSKNFSQSDQSEQLKDLFQKGEEAFLKKNHDAAKEIFLELKKKSKRGILFNAATQRLAQLIAEEGNYKAAYDLLCEADDVSEEIFPLFQRAAYEVQDYKRVEKFGNVCFQNDPSPEIAIRNANACAVLGKAEASIGWLKAAMKEGLEDPLPIIDKPLYDKVRQTSDFQEFIKSLK